MKKKQTILFAVAFVSVLMASCRDDWDGAGTDGFLQERITSPTDVGPATMTISEFKDAYQGLFAQGNSFELVEEDLILEGVVISNDRGGNLYQSVIVGELEDGRVSPRKCLQIALKNTCLYPFFQIGQKVRINVKGLYIGCYSYLPKIGQPYYTSAGNLRLGPALLQYCKTKVYLDGVPSDYASLVHPDTIPDNSSLWTDKGEQNYRNCPMLVTCEGYFQLNDTTKHLADYEEHDAGYGVNRDFKVGNSTITVRTSTQNEVSYIQIPKNTQRVRLTGILSYYSGWQLQILDKESYVLIDN